jgi:hypothetical protein
MNKELSPAAREARNAYQREYRRRKPANNAYHREWRRRNPDKIRQYNLNYWERKANEYTDN